jgi:hypothetical protein
MYSNFDYETDLVVRFKLEVTKAVFCNVLFSLSFICVVLRNKPNFALKLSLCFISATKLSLLWNPAVAKGFSAVFTVYSIEQPQNPITDTGNNRQNYKFLSPHRYCQ